MRKVLLALCLDNKNPKFSWIIDTDHYNVLQTHYQVFVATDKVFSKNSLVWDSGKVASEESVYVNYLGKELAYDTQYFWTVKVWTNKSKRSSQSKVSSWKTGLMDKQNWKSNWITVNNEDMTSPKIPYFINDFIFVCHIFSLFMVFQLGTHKYILQPFLYHQ